MGSDLTEVTDLGMVEWGFIPVKIRVSIPEKEKYITDQASITKVTFWGRTWTKTSPLVSI